MNVKYKVKTVRFQSGERFPVLMDSRTGMPLFEPVVFVLTELRTANRAFSTLRQALRSVMVGLQIFNHLGIDLNKRVDEGRILDISEIDAIARFCRMDQVDIDRLPSAEDVAESASAKVISLEAARMSVRDFKASPEIEPESAGIRMMYIRDYIGWLVQKRMLKMSVHHPAYQHLWPLMGVVLNAFKERIPASPGRDVVGQRQGLDAKVRERLLEVIDPTSPENPWKSHHVRVRNQLVINWLLDLGLRKSELLVIRIEDINQQTNEVLVPRTADDDEDPRLDQPLAKTFDRLLVLGDDLAEQTREYVMKVRRKIKGARRHSFLIVANGSGAPLSKSALNKMFVELRRKVPGLPEELVPHVLRHDWNDRFSELMDSQNIPPETEQKLRSQQMGWSQKSKTASVYTRRHTVKKSNKASLELQNKAYGKGKAKT